MWQKDHMGYLLLWILACHLTTQVSGSGVFELQLQSFRNDEGLNENENCCSGIRKAGQCESSCRTFFKICLKEFQAHISFKPPCTFGSLTTPVLGGNSFPVPEAEQAFTNPIQLPFDFSWPGDFTLIIEAWHDLTKQGPSQGSPRELITRLATQRSVGVGEVWRNDTHDDVTGAALQYGYRVVCSPNHYGPRCSDYCEPRDDRFGHYTCDDQGQLVCIPGWTGEYCDKAECLAGCHAEHGFCSKPNECECHNGWGGHFCDECIPYPGCQHGTCNGESFKCYCQEGWGGLFCNQDLNYCTHHRPCKNDATCTNTGAGGYTCTCLTGFSGTNCEIEKYDCLHQPCLNGGSCTDMASDYHCLCPSGFHGRHCESSATSCDEMPCMHEGSCLSLVEGYRCNCRPGYTGVNCEAEINECQSSPCINGNCVDDLNGYHCLCRPGYFGDHCHETAHFCDTLDEPCQNGGSCVDKINDFECRCVPGFVGALCEEVVDICQTFPCANAGTCHSIVNDFRCDCAPGYTGKDCFVNVDDCAARPCHNAPCTDLVDDYSCACAQGFHGKECQYSENGLSPPDVTSPSWPVTSPSYTPSTPVPADDPTQHSLMLQVWQLLLIICLGVGIPIIVIIVIIVILLCKRRQSRDGGGGAGGGAGRGGHVGAHKDNEQNEITNMNNKHNRKSAGSPPPPSSAAAGHVSSHVASNVILGVPPPPGGVLKITNEEQKNCQRDRQGALYNGGSGSSSEKLHLNVDKPCSAINKNYMKDNLRTSSRTKKDILEEMPQRKASSSRPVIDCSNPLERGGSSLEYAVVDSSEYCRPGDLHLVKPLNTDGSGRPTSSIFYLDSHPHHSYREGMLATEV